MSSLNSDTNSTTNSTSEKKGISVFTLAMINVAAIVSLRGLAGEAEYGLSSIFYYLFAAFFFLIPVALVSAEMATSWTEKGGVFRWVGEAFGGAWGFVAIFLQWIQNTIWFPTVLTFAAVSLAFIGTDMAFDTTLAADKNYTLAIVLGVYWLATFLNFRGAKFSGAISKWGVIIGTLIPGILLITLGIAYVATGNPVYLDWNSSQLIPQINSFNSLALAVSIFLFYAGMEMSSVHVKDVDNPQKNYPRAIFLSSLITVLLFVFGTLAIAIVIPQNQISLTQSLLIAYDNLFKAFGVEWLGSVVAACLAFGVFGQVSTWIAGPSKGILTVGKAGYLPVWLQKTNAENVQVNILLLQAIIVTCLAIMFVLLPTVQAAYQILSALTITLYLIMYMLMFAAFIKLRFSQSYVKRYFRVPFGNIGMWFFGGLGFCSSAVAFFFGFFPPSQIAVGSPMVWVALLVIGNGLGIVIPLTIYTLRKPEWIVDPEGFAPFSREVKFSNHADDTGNLKNLSGITS